MRVRMRLLSRRKAKAVGDRSDCSGQAEQPDKVRLDSRTAERRLAQEESSCVDGRGREPGRAGPCPSAGLLKSEGEGEGDGPDWTVDEDVLAAPTGPEEEPDMLAASDDQHERVVVVDLDERVLRSLRQSTTIIFSRFAF